MTSTTYDFRTMSYDTAEAMMEMAQACRAAMQAGTPEGYAVAVAFTKLADALHVPANAYGVLREAHHDGI